MNYLNSRINEIEQKINKASRFLERYSHKRISFNAPINLAKLIDIENHYEIKFPDEYRAFITTIGNGGSGPDSGLLSLEDSLVCPYAAREKEPLNKDFLKIPFTHASTYNPSDDPYILELGKKCDRGEIPQSECDAVYDHLTAGTLTISLEGCGYHSRLVITGATRGQVWFDGDAGDAGYIHLNLSFFDWYEKWLDDNFKW